MLGLVTTEDKILTKNLAFMPGQNNNKQTGL
jgi:hypothetical protein